MQENTNSTKSPNDLNYYEILGVPKDATPNDLKKAYKKKALKMYAIKKYNEKDEEDFKKVAKAYEVLSDPAMKDHYDKHGTSGSEEIEEMDKAKMEDILDVCKLYKSF